MSKHPSFLAFALITLATLAAWGCGASVPVMPIVTISPATVTLQAGGGQQQFTATVADASNTAVVWKVNGHMGGDSTTGTITQQGLYAAPEAVPTGGQVDVEAFSVANANSTATAVVKLTAPVAITLTPATATVAPGGTVQFQATVTNTTNTSVTWSVQGTKGGNATYGTISATGLYTAPATFPGSGQVTVTATSVADPAISANATVTLQQAVTVTLSPASANVPISTSLAFTAAVTGATDTSVTFSVNGVAGGNATLGVINAKGVFTAPATVPSPATETVTATSNADNTKSASAKVTIVPPVAVTISPATVSLALGASQTFTATVTNSTNTAVTWSVNGKTGGDSTVGTITTAGVYTAPATAPGTQTVNVTATSAADPTASANAVVTLLIPISITISPTSAIVNLASTQTFTATVTGGSGANTGVAWSVNNVAGGNATLGTIDTNGVFTAPKTMPTPATETITATSQADATKSASATVTLQVPPNDFTLSPTTNSLTLAKADSQSVTLQATLSAGFTNPVTFTAAGAPPNVGITFSPASLTASGPVQVTFTSAPISLAVSAVPITITGTSKDNQGNPIVQTATVLLTVTGWTGQMSTLAGRPGGPGFADGTGTAALLYPSAVTSDGGQNLFFADIRGEALRQYNLASAAVTTLIGDTAYTFTVGEGDGIAYDPDNKTVYISDDQKDIITAYVLGTGDTSSVLAGTPFQSGNADGVGAAARFNHPQGLVISPDHSALYLADAGNDAIRKIVIATGAVTTVANHGFCVPKGLAIDSAGANLYLSDACNPEIDQLNLATAAVTTVAGSTTQGNTDGPAATATFEAPTGLAMDPHPGVNILYIADRNAIRALVLGANPTVYTVAGAFASGSADGSGSAARFYFPNSLTALADLSGTGTTTLFVADSLNGLLRQVAITNPLTVTKDGSFSAAVTTLAGVAPYRGSADGIGTGSGYNGTSVAQFDQPEGIVTDGKVAYVADANNGAIRKIDLATTQVTTVAGPGLGYKDGPANQANFFEDAGLAWDQTNNIIYISDTGDSLIRKLDLNTNTVSTIAGVFGSAGHVDGPAAQAEFNHPYGILVSPDGTKLYIAEAGNDDIRLIDLTTSTVSTIAGSGSNSELDGIGTAAHFQEPNGMAWSPDHQNIYISDYEGETIRELNLSTLAVTTVVGKANTCGNADGPVGTATLCTPAFVATDGRSLFWADADVGLLRVLDLATKQVYTLAGWPSTSPDEAILAVQNGAYTEKPGTLTGPVLYNNPFGIALAPDGSFILLTDKLNNTIRILH